MNEFNDYSIILVGLGPHAKRIYMNLFKKYRMSPKIIVDLKSKRENKARRHLALDALFSTIQAIH